MTTKSPAYSLLKTNPQQNVEYVTTLVVSFSCNLTLHLRENNPLDVLDCLEFGSKQLTNSCGAARAFTLPSGRTHIVVCCRSRRLDDSGIDPESAKTNTRHFLRLSSATVKEKSPKVFE